MLLEISVPDFSTLSRRGRGLSLPARPKIKITDPVHLAIDSTGLKVFDEGEWLQSKYNGQALREAGGRRPNANGGVNFTLV